MNTDNLSGLQDSLLTDLCRFIDNYTYVVDTEDEYLFIYQYICSFIVIYLDNYLSNLRKNKIKEHWYKSTHFKLSPLYPYR